MAVDKFGKQMYPGMLSDVDKDYIPDPSHLFPIVMLRKLTGKEINEAFKGIHPVPSTKANTISIDNIRNLNNNYETVNDAENTAILMTDDIPDDPFIDNIDSDDDLPDLSNLTTEGDKKSEKKDKITDKKGFNGQNKEEEIPKQSNTKADKLQHNENGKINKKSKEIFDTKQSKKDTDQNKNIDKEKIKNGKKVNDRREHEKGKKENKTQSRLLDNVIQLDSSMELKGKEKVSSIDGLRKSDRNASENNNGIINSTPSKDFSTGRSKSTSSKKSAKLSTDSEKFNSDTKTSSEPKVNVHSSTEVSSTDLKDKEKEPSFDNLRKSDLRKSDKNISENDKVTNNSSTSKDFSSSCSKSSSSKNSAESSTDSVKFNSNPIQSDELKAKLPSSNADSSTKLRNKEKNPTFDGLKISDLSKSEINTSENAKCSSSTSKDCSSKCSKSPSSKSTAKSSTDSLKLSSSHIPSVEPTVNALSSIVDSSKKMKDTEKVPSLDNLRISDKSSGNISDTDNNSRSKDLPSVSSKLSSSQTSTESSKEIRMFDKSLGNISDSDSSSKSKDLSSISSESSSSQSSNKSLNEINRSMNSNPVPSAEPKISLLPFLAKTREVKKKKAISKEQKVLNSIQFSIPVFIKSEPEDITDPEDSMAFEAPLLNSQEVSSPIEPVTKTRLSNGETNPQPSCMSSLPNDGEFTSQIDSDQETVDFGATLENNLEDNNGNENRYYRKEENKKNLDEIEKRSDTNDNKDKNDIENNHENNNENNHENEKRNSRKKGNKKSSDEIKKKRSDTIDDRDKNKRKRDQIGMEKKYSREEEKKENSDEMEKPIKCDNNDLDIRNKRNKESIKTMEDRNSRKKENEKAVYQVENKRTDKEYDKDENKRKRDSSESTQETKKLKGDSGKMEVEIDKGKKGSNSDLSSQITTMPYSNQKQIINIESKTNLEESKSIKQKDDSKSVSELAVKSVPPIAGVPSQEVDQRACTPPTMISRSSPVNSAAIIVQSSSVTQPSVNPADILEKEKSSLVSFSALQSKGERIKALKKIAGMCKSIMKKHSSEEKLQNECEEIKRKIILVESKIFEIQKEEERRMAELDILHTQLDDIDDEEKIAEYAEKMIDLTDCTEIRDKKSNLEKEKRKLVSEQDGAENSLLEAKAERKREELEMASLKASLNSSSRGSGLSSSPGPEMGDSNSSKQICLSLPFSHSANNQATSPVRNESGRQLQQRQILPNPSLSQQQYQHPQIRQDQSQGVVTTLGEQMLYETQNGPSNCRQISCNEDMVLIPKSKFDLMQKDEMQRMMQTPVSRHMIQRQETIIKTYQTDMGSMGTIQQQQMMAMQQGQGLIHQQQDITQQNLVQASPSTNVPQQTTIMTPQQQVSRGTSGQQSVIMVPQQSPEGMVEQIGMMSQQKQQTGTINKSGSVLYPTQGFQAGPASSVFHQQQLSSSDNTQQTIMKPFNGQELTTYHAKESLLQPRKLPEQPGRTEVSSPQNIVPSDQTRISGPELMVMQGQPNVPSPQQVMPSGQSRLPGPKHAVMPDQRNVSSPQHVIPPGPVGMSGSQHVVMPSQANVSSPQHVISSGQARMSSCPQHVMIPDQTKLSSPQHMIPSGQARLPGPNNVVMPVQSNVSSPQHVSPSGQVGTSVSQHVVMPSQTKLSSPQHMIPSVQARMSDPHHVVMPDQAKVSSSQYVIPSNQARLSGPQHVVMPGQTRIPSSQNVMSVQSGTSSPQLVSSLCPPPPYSKALTRVASVASSQSPISQHQNKISNSISSNSVLSQILQAPKITQANPKPCRTEPISKKPGSHNHLQVQALQTQQTIMNEQRQKRLMSQGKADSASGEGSFKCEGCGVIILKYNLFEAHHRNCGQRKQETNRASCQETTASIPSGAQHSASISSGITPTNELNSQQVLQVGDKHQQIQSQVPITVPTMAQVHNILQSQPANTHAIQSQQQPHKEDIFGKPSSTDSNRLQDNSNKYSSRKCPIPGCDGKGNTDSRRFNHISASACPKVHNKNFKTQQNVSNVTAVPCITTSSSSSFADSRMMAPNQSVTDVNMDDTTTPPQPTCFLCGKHGEFTCCGDTIYCGVDCQEADFDRHQVECKNMSFGSSKNMSFINIGLYSTSPKNIGIYGSSHAKKFPISAFTDKTIKVIHKAYLTCIELEWQDNKIQELIDITPKLDAVILFIGGNDIDRTDLKGTQEKIVIDAFQTQITRLLKYNITPYILPIQKRKRPHNLEPGLFNTLAHFYNKSLTEMTQKFNHKVMIEQPKKELTLKKDGIQLTEDDYIIIADSITRHIKQHPHQTQYTTDKPLLFHKSK